MKFGKSMTRNRDNVLTGCIGKPPAAGRSRTKAPTYPAWSTVRARRTLLHRTRGQPSSRRFTDKRGIVARFTVRRASAAFPRPAVSNADGGPSRLRLKSGFFSRLGADLPRCPTPCFTIPGAEASAPRGCPPATRLFLDICPRRDANTQICLILRPLGEHHSCTQAIRPAGERRQRREARGVLVRAQRPALRMAPNHAHFRAQSAPKRLPRPPRSDTRPAFAELHKARSGAIPRRALSFEPARTRACRRTSPPAFAPPSGPKRKRAAIPTRRRRPPRVPS